MSSVEWVRFMTDPSEFQIYFKDSIEEIVTDYTAESPYECGALRCHYSLATVSICSLASLLCSRDCCQAQVHPVEKKVDPPRDGSDDSFVFMNKLCVSSAFLCSSFRIMSEMHKLERVNDTQKKQRRKCGCSGIN